MEEAVVVAVFGRQAICELGDQLLVSRAVGSLLRRRGPLAAGDRVQVERSGDEGIVRQRSDRTTALRRAPRRPGAPVRVVAANVDLVVGVLSVRQPPFRSGLADRILAAASVAGIDAALCFNKWDLAQRSDEEATAPYRKIGVPVICTSVLDGTGIDSLSRTLKGRDSVIVGHSGVGKSSLLGRLVPGLQVRVHEVNRVTGRGRHTTTTATLVRLPFGGSLIDTPGIRAFGLAGVEPRDLWRHFPEFRRFEGRCEFADCEHESEPGCALLAAVDDGSVPAVRHEGYLRMLASLRAGRG